MNPNPAFPETFQETMLVQRAQAGDRVAFDRLAAHYRAALKAIAFLRTGELQDAEDLVQEVLTRAWRSLPTLLDPAAFMPWLKTIAANACTSWYRRSRPWPDLLSLEPDVLLTVDHSKMPLEALLARERRRELRKALAALPDANRLALMLHAWGGYSYEEIARFAGVQETTVEGRIYRARRQLRRLLQDAGVEFSGEPSRREPSKADGSKQRLRRKPMTQIPLDTEPQEMSQPLALVLFTRQFSALLDAGLPLLRILDILQQTPPPYGDAARKLYREIEKGACLSQEMAKQPELFPDFYCVLIRAGELAGVLEETLQRAAEMMTKEWRLAGRRPPQEGFAFFTLPSPNPSPQDWMKLSSYQRTATLALFCETFGLMLSSGVPILQTLRTLAKLLPPEQKAGLMEACEAIKTGEPIIPGLERMGIFPRFTLELIALGEEAGSLDRMLHRAAEVFEHELECRMIEV